MSTNRCGLVCARVSTFGISFRRVDCRNGFPRGSVCCLTLAQLCGIFVLGSRLAQCSLDRRHTLLPPMDSEQVYLRLVVGHALAGDRPKNGPRLTIEKLADAFDARAEQL